jgi:glycosyltransferase involved in cell wall biosynthesis
VLALVPSEAAFYGVLGIDPAKIRVVGAPATSLPGGGPDVRERHGLGDDPLVLFLGVKERYKGYGLLLEAAPAIWERHPRARLAFVGPPTDASREDFATVRDERVIEIGRVEDDEVAAWHRAATVFCLPSTSEIMPVSILEAWSQGTPVVAARWWCAADLIADGADGRIVEADAGELAEAVSAVLGDPAAARAMGEAGRRKVADEFGPAAVAARHEAAYLDAQI